VLNRARELLREDIDRALQRNGGGS
jgi:hypothetical protein